jgi:hypothetical protein
MKDALRQQDMLVCSTAVLDHDRMMHLEVHQNALEKYRKSCQLPGWDWPGEERHAIGFSSEWL